MNVVFHQELIDFLNEFHIEYSLYQRNGLWNYLIDDNNIVIVEVPLDYFANHTFLAPFSGTHKTIYLFEDRWIHSRQNVKQRLLSHFGIGKTIFARNCQVREISSLQATTFLDKYHSYRATKAKFKYGLFTKEGKLVAVSTFSSPREMNREGEILDSYEWVRYSSFPDTRVVGGMGKMMKSFIDNVHPQEIMSYADREWSEGEVYLKLGFNKDSERNPVSFMINPETMERISEIKIKRDKKYSSLDTSDYIKITNLGSIKYLLRIGIK